jgi:hypothetical protein
VPIPLPIGSGIHGYPRLQAKLPSLGRSLPRVATHTPPLATTPLTSSHASGEEISLQLRAVTPPSLAPATASSTPGAYASPPTALAPYRCPSSPVNGGPPESPLQRHGPNTARPGKPRARPGPYIVPGRGPPPQRVGRHGPARWEQCRPGLGPLTPPHKTSRNGPTHPTPPTLRAYKNTHDASPRCPNPNPIPHSPCAAAQPL